MRFPNWLDVYGDKSFRGDCPREDVELATFWNQLCPELRKRAWHTENEGKRNHEKSRMKGQLKGVSDIVVIGAPPLIIEMKRQDHTKSRWQDGQLEFLKACHEAGAMVCIALGYKSALEAVEEWKSILQLEKT